MAPKRNCSAVSSSKDSEPESKRKKLNSIAESWREIHGQDDWEEMLDPINPHLRTELIRYGEMAQACYDAFDRDPYSKYRGSCNFKRGEFFKSVGLANCGYEVTCYLYSTYNVRNFWAKILHKESSYHKANWMGFVAVSNDETSKKLGRRDITIAWRGTNMNVEWLANAYFLLKPVADYGIRSPNDQKVKAEAGFLHLYTDKEPRCRFSRYSAREQVVAEVNRLKQIYRKEEISITITGHSLGSALATLNAYDIVETGLAKAEGHDIHVSVFSFSGPKVGNIKFTERVKELGVKVLRVVNSRDLVPFLPLLVFGYCHAGQKLALNHNVSSYLKNTSDRVCAHNLEAHLHLLDGYHGKDPESWCANGRDIALVNKFADFLTDSCKIPPNWFQTENKGLVKDPTSGHWVKWERNDLDDDVPPKEDIDSHLRQLGLIE